MAWLTFLRARSRKLAALQRGERRLLLEAPLLLPLAAWALRRHRLGELQRRLGRRVPARLPTYPDEAAAMAAARRIAWAVQVGAAYGPWPANCLQRSLVCWWFLRRRGLEGQLRIGVRRNKEQGGMEFHAWVERDGELLNDYRRVVETYAVFDRPIAPKDASFD